MKDSDEEETNEDGFDQFKTHLTIDKKEKDGWGAMSEEQQTSNVSKGDQGEDWTGFGDDTEQIRTQVQQQHTVDS